MNSATANIEGHLNIFLAPAAAEGRVSIVSSRPLTLCRLFEGRSAADTLKTIPLLFNICGQAQGIAAVRAFESALQTPATEAVEVAREDLNRLEMLREHLFRILADWPQYYGQQPDHTLLASLVSHINRLRNAIDPEHRLLTQPGLHNTRPLAAAVQEQMQAIRDILHHTLYMTDPVTWLQYNATQLMDWIDSRDTPFTRLLRHVREQGWQSLGAADTAALPELDCTRLLAQLDHTRADDFIANPRWDETVYETGAYARLLQHPLLRSVVASSGPGLLARLVARIIEIADLFNNMDIPNPQHQARFSDGLSQLEAARGRLCHRVQIDGQQVTRYQILAPTEWNFSTQGPVVQALSQVAQNKGTPLHAQASLLIHAIDPCVGFSLHIDHQDPVIDPQGDLHHA